MVPFALSLLVLLPIVGSVLVLLVPKQYVKPFAVIWSLIPLAFAGYLWFVQYDPYAAGMQFEEIYRWIDSLNVRYHVGVDGLSMPLIFLATLLTTIGLFYSAYTIEERVREFSFMFLLLGDQVLFVHARRFRLYAAGDHRALYQYEHGNNTRHF
jgi:NADH:ubiquinone oxidoreductase subunit 4 (subunit M)